MTEAEQRLQHIASIFDEVNRTYFGGVIPAPTVSINTRMTHTAGQVDCRTWAMDISPEYHDHYGWEEELVETVKHEAVHLYLAHMKRPAGHTSEFKAICVRIGASHYSKPMPRHRRHYRYLVQCPRCWVPRYRRGWRRDLACRECCKKYNGGRYSPQFALQLVKREIVQ